MFSWGADHGFRDDNPFRKIKKFKLTGTIKPWTMSEISKFRKVAYKELNEAIAFALFTGQREGDICKFTWSQDKFRHLEWFKQGKTGAEMFIPIHPLFRKIIDGIDKRAVVILTTKTGHPWRPEYLSKETTKYAKKAGLDGCVFHGLRKTATVILADAGCTTEEIKAITGHKTLAMISHYSEKARRRVRAKSAVVKMGRRMNKSVKQN